MLLYSAEEHLIVLSSRVHCSSLPGFTQFPKTMRMFILVSIISYRHQKLSLPIINLRILQFLQCNQCLKGLDLIILCWICIRMCILAKILKLCLKSIILRVVLNHFSFWNSEKYWIILDFQRPITSEPFDGFWIFLCPSIGFWVWGFHFWGFQTSRATLYAWSQNLRLLARKAPNEKF